MKKPMKMSVSASKDDPAGWLRARRACSSSPFPSSTVTMSSTAREMPPAKSPARNAGTIVSSMISLECRSVSVPSSP
jgi:hypothetical protein